MYRVKFVLKTSRWLFLIQFFLHGMALLALLYADIGIGSRISGIFLLVVSGYWQCWRMALGKGARTIVEGLATNDRWWLQDRLRRKYEVRLVNDNFVTVWLMILNFREVASSRSITLRLAPDSLGFTAFRRLRILMQYKE